MTDYWDCESFRFGGTGGVLAARPPNGTADEKAGARSVRPVFDQATEKKP